MKRDTIIGLIALAVSIIGIGVALWWRDHDATESRVHELERKLDLLDAITTDRLNQMETRMRVVERFVR